MTAVMDPIPTTAPVAPTPGTRLAWRVVAGLAAAALLLWGVTQTVSVLAHEEHTETVTFPAAGVAEIDVRLESGSVDIVAADVEEITVRARISDGLRRTGHDERLVDGRLVLEGTCPIFLSTFCAVHYDVQVPRDLDVVAHLDSGRLEVVGVHGSVEAASDNGSVAVTDVVGDIAIHSDNGSLEGEGLDAETVTASSDNGSIDLGFAEAPTTVTAESDNGSVELRLPEVAGGYLVDMDTDNGSTDLGVATDPGSTRRITATSDNGAIRVLSTEGTLR
jgi:hypothetical protein